MLPQSSVVDSLNIGMRELYTSSDISSIEGFNVDILAQVHDSILIQVPIGNLTNRIKFEQLHKRICDATSPTLKYNNREFKIASDFKIGLNWSEHKIKNPKGMQKLEDFNSFMKILDHWKVNSDKKTEGLA